MQELLKSWKEFESSQEGKNDETCQNYPTLEIRIPAEYVTSSNRQVSNMLLIHGLFPSFLSFCPTFPFPLDFTCKNLGILLHKDA